MHKFKKTAPAAIASLIAFTAVLHADGATLPELKNRVSALEKGYVSDTNPAARPNTSGVDVYLLGEFLWLKPYEDDLVFAMDTQSVIPSANSNINATTKDWKGKFGPAFRLGIGYNTPYDGWDVDLKWLHFNSRHQEDDDDDCCDQCSCAVTGVFQPEMFPKDYSESPAGTIPVVTNVKPNRWKLQVNEFTLQLGREFFVSPWVTLRPHVGVKGAWIHQSARVDYSNGTFTNAFQASFAGTTIDHLRQKNHFWGVGLQGGLHTTWGVGYGISVFTRSDIALLRGKIHVTQSHTLDNGIATSQRTFIKHKFKATRPIAELALGIRYDTTTKDDCYAFGAWIGWEHHVYWSQNKMIKFEGRNYNVLDEWDGDLALGGLAIGGSVDF